MVNSSKMIPILEQKINDWLVVWIWYEWVWNQANKWETLSIYNIENFYTVYFRSEAWKVLWIQDFLKYSPQYINKKVRKDIIRNYFGKESDDQSLLILEELPKDKVYYENINNTMKDLWINNMQELISKTDNELSDIIAKLWYNEYNIILSILGEEIENKERYENIRYISNTIRLECIKSLFKENENIYKFLNSRDHKLSKEEMEEIKNHFLSEIYYTELERDIKDRFVRKQRYECAAFMRDIEAIKKNRTIVKITKS